MKTSIEIVLKAMGTAQVTGALGAVQAAAGRVKAGLASMAGYFVGPTALGVAATATAAGFAAAAKSAISFSDSLTKAAARSGMLVEEMSALVYAGNLADVKMQDLQTAARGLARWLEATGQTGRTMTEVLLETADLFASMPDGPEKVAIAVERFGRSGQQMITLLNAGSAGIRQMTEEARRMGLVIDSQTGKAAELFNDNLTRLKETSRGFFMTLSSHVLPSLVLVSQQMLAFTRTGPAAGSMWEWIGKMASYAAGRVNSYIEVLVRLTGFSTAYLKTLIATRSISEALTQGFLEAGNAAERYRDLLKELSETQAPLPTSGLAFGDGDGQGPGGRIKQLREGVNLHIEENRLITQKYEIEMAEGKALNELRLQQLNIERNLVSERRQLTADNGSELTEAERRKLEIEDKRHLLEIDRERRRILQQPIDGSFVGSTGLQFGAYQDAAGFDRQSGMGGGFMAGIQQSMMQLGTAAQQVGQAVTTSIGGALSGIASSIEGLIHGTIGWAQAFANVGRQILNAVVGAFSQMIAQMAVSFALQKVFGAAATKQAAAVGAAWHSAAISASIATYGTAAAIGLGAFMSAQASGVAAATGMQVGAGGAGFQGGGYTGDGAPNQIAGVVHRREFVVPAPAVSRIGLGNLEAMVGAGRPVSGGSDGGRQNVHVYIDRRAWLDAVRDDVEGIAVDAFRRHA